MFVQITRPVVKFTSVLIVIHDKLPLMVSIRGRPTLIGNVAGIAVFAPKEISVPIGRYFTRQYWQKRTSPSANGHQKSSEVHQGWGNVG